VQQADAHECANKAPQAHKAALGGGTRRDNQMEVKEPLKRSGEELEAQAKELADLLEQMKLNADSQVQLFFESLLKCEQPPDMLQTFGRNGQ
jgi:hypothetical protein